MVAQRNQEKKITKAYRDEAGTIYGFEINGNTRIKYKYAVEKGRKGELVGINLYPELVNDITREHKITGFWNKLLWYVRKRIKK
ncbi:hypothetical protein JCM14036_28460 [Desulfotomaculum defluvii]